MRPGPAPAWLPPFVVGGAAAVAGELSVGLLLYTAAGFLEALTLILVVQLGALGLGVWSAPAPGRNGWDGVRRRWHLALVAFTAAAIGAAAWDLVGGLASRAVLRGLGLALLAALPLYAAGTLLGAMAELRRSDEVRAPVAAPALLGAAAGAALTGLVGPRLPPVTVYLGCVVLLSAASLVHGRVLDRRTRTRVLARHRSARGELRVEERVGRGRRDLAILENGVLRAGRDHGGRPLRAWEEGAARLLEADGAPRRLLVVGAGADAVPALLPPATAVTMAEPDEALAALLAEHLPGRGVAAPAGEPCDLVRGVVPAGPWDAVVVDASAWPGREPVPQLPRATLDALARSLEPGGRLVIGGVGLERGPQGEAAATDPGLAALVAEARAAGLADAAAWVPEGAAADGVVAFRRAGGAGEAEAPGTGSDDRGPAHGSEGAAALPGWRRVPAGR